MTLVPRPTILVAEDDPDLLRFTETSLRLAGYRTLVASDGEQALALLRRRVDCLVLDLGLPRVDGYTVLRTLRADARLAKLPVVVVSAAAPPAEPDPWLWYLAKPVSADALVRAIARALASPSSPS